MSMGNVVAVVYGVRFPRKDYERMCDAVARARLDVKGAGRDALEMHDGGEHRYAHGVIAVESCATQVTWSGGPTDDAPYDAAEAIGHAITEKMRVALAALHSLAMERGIACAEPRWWIVAGYF